MKIYIGKNKILLVGKAWEVKQKLKEYSIYYDNVYHCINECTAPTNLHK